MAPRKAIKPFVRAIASVWPLFHAFLYFFSRWLKDNPLDWVADLAQYALSPDVVDINPRMKPFRDYHMVTDSWDIIHNGITCTRGAMWNSVIISNGDSMTELIDVSDHLAPSDKIVRVFNEPNADLDVYSMMSETKASGWRAVNNRVLVANCRMAQGLRKMYRGELVIRGNAKIKPSDIIYMYDMKNMIWGPIEVERVTHSLTPGGGFMTKILPQCYVEANNYDGGFTSLIESTAFNVIGVGIPLAAGSLAAAAGGFSPLAIGLGIGFWQSGRKLTRHVIAHMKRNKTIPQWMGGPTWGKDHLPVRIYPLARMGAPWVAALSGLVKHKDIVARFNDKARDAAAGLEFMWKMMSEFGEGLEDYDGTIGNSGAD